MPVSLVPIPHSSASILCYLPTIPYNLSRFGFVRLTRFSLHKFVIEGRKINELPLLGRTSYYIFTQVICAVIKSNQSSSDLYCLLMVTVPLLCHTALQLFQLIPTIESLKTRQTLTINRLLHLLHFDFHFGVKFELNIWIQLFLLRFCC